MYTECNFIVQVIDSGTNRRKDTDRFRYISISHHVHNFMDRTDFRSIASGKCVLLIEILCVKLSELSFSV